MLIVFSRVFYILYFNIGFSTRGDCTSLATLSPHVSSALHRYMAGETWFLPIVQKRSVIYYFILIILHDKNQFFDFFILTCRVWYGHLY